MYGQHMRPDMRILQHNSETALFISPNEWANEQNLPLSVAVPIMFAGVFREKR
jgi:hypothetical protein